MRRISILTAIALTLAMVIYGQSQTPQSKSSAPKSESSGANNQRAKPKGRLLVKRLPNGVEGVVIKNGMVRVKPGYKFVKGEDGKVSVYLMSGGGGGLPVSGSWDCYCTKESGSGVGTCKAVVSGDYLSCLAGAGCSECKLSVIFGMSTKPIVAY